MIDEVLLDRLIANGMVKLLIVGGEHIWEASPSSEHQMTVDEIRATIHPAWNGSGTDCGCHHLADTYLWLGEESLVRPDIAIWCRRPPRQRAALRVIPQAVVEIISPDYAEKDLEKLPPKYLAAGVLDVLVYDPTTGAITWWDQEGGVEEPQHLTAPQTIRLRCDCQVTIG